MRTEDPAMLADEEKVTRYPGIGWQVN